MSTGFGLISAVVFLPAFGAVALACVPRRLERAFPLGSLAVSLITLLLSIPLFTGFETGTAAFQFVERMSWIPTLGVGYHVGIDGISLFLVLLTTLLGVLAIASSFTAITDRTKEFYIFLLLLETSMLGVFVALDFFLFYVFWEAMLIPMAFLIGVWGGPRRIYAAVKFFLYTLFGSLLMLVAIIVLYFYHQSVNGFYTTDLLAFFDLQIPRSYQMWLFGAFALSFAIKVPMWPFHTWLPDAHVEAPTAGSVILAGVLLKMGTYGFVRFCLPLFPDASIYFMPLIMTLAVIGIIYGALVAMVQTDMKKLVAYSSVSHLGVVMLGLFALNMQGIEGALLQMVNHGLSTGALFLLVGMIYERRHVREISAYGGIARVMPTFAVFFVIATMSSIGLPLLNGFVGEFLIIIGSYPTQPAGAIIAALGVVLSAVGDLEVRLEEDHRLPEIETDFVGYRTDRNCHKLLVGVEVEHTGIVVPELQIQRRVPAC
ncbi:MAG: NADH-quinone oxidoreductase subunit M, partial [Nitrospinae bacterium]|nr:NADH-quinone oxidoreductase subunit M [Nitrospinota bacterium]